jgi:GTP cyclohydrolase II
MAAAALGTGGAAAAAAAGAAEGDPNEVIGLVVYLQQEGRGIGLAAKVAAYALQEGPGGEVGRGVDTVDANRALGLPDDSREYSAVGHILRDLGLGAQPLYLLSNNPRKGEALGVPVERRLPCLVPPISDAAALYLKAKAQRMGHDIPAPFWAAAAAAAPGEA